MVFNTEENKILEEQLYPEMIKSERMRVTLLAAIALITTVVFAFYLVFFSDDIRTKVPSLYPLYIIAGVFALLFIRELIVIGFIKKKYDKKEKITPTVRYINTLIECSFPSVVLILGIMFWNNSVALFSPVVFLYFLMIILSTLSLDFWLSIFAGIVSAIEYLGIAFYSEMYLEKITTEAMLNSYYYHFGKGIILLVGGFVAGFVALQLRKRIAVSFEVLSERNKIINLFGQQVSPEIVTELITQKESIKTKSKYVCIMFLDIRGFTPFAEKLSPEELNEYQNKVFGYMIEIIAENYGVINQFLGDGYMATFGAPVSKGNDSQNAVNAAIEIINKTNNLSKENKIPQTRVGIGLHAGYVVAGNIGTSLRKQYSITGNTVIISSRLEQLNKEFNSQLLVSEEVFKAVSLEKFNVLPENIGEVKVKGREKPINLYKIL